MTTHPPVSMRPRARRAFTLIEILVVAAVIVVLLAIVAGVGVAVLNRQQGTATSQVLSTLDRALDEYMQTAGNGAPPKYSRADYVEVPGPSVVLGDSKYFRDFGSAGTSYPIRPDAAVFVRQTIGAGRVQDIIQGIGERFLRLTTTPGQGAVSGRDIDPTPSIVDLWAKEDWVAPFDPATSSGDTNQSLIYYVHPNNLLAQELYGRCVNGRPYFMSAGPDRKYGLRSEFPASATKDEVENALKDNVYSYAVGPANLTQDFFDGYR
ncbi:MAG: prepilin-type N-terminal cleavage/methylation domain-containing protein [Planctomycetota bacterium]|nr:prepilin-type N-terminal cleavage/methylation domain-containing protein [Planctomycetota bacterium]